MATKATKIFGPPGTGKTETLIKIILESGIELDKISYVTFGRDAMDSMKDRMYKRGISDASIPYFKTIHGLNFKLLGIRKEQIADMRLNEFSKEKKKSLTPKRGSTEDIPYTDTYADGETLDDMFYKQMQKDRTELRPFNFIHPKWKSYASAFMHFKHSYFDWLREHDYIDFIGIIEQGIAQGIVPPVDMLCVDEWQDLNPLQVKQVQLWASQIPISYHVGDEDQTIYAFSGADPTAFLNFQCDEELILGETFRLPSDVLALSQEIIKRNTNRKEKDIMSNKPDGGIYFKTVASACTMIKQLPKGETCFVLVRNNFVIPRIMKELLEYGIPMDRLKKERDAVRMMMELKKKGKDVRFGFDEVDLLCSTALFPSVRYFNHGSKGKMKKLLAKSFPQDGYTADDMIGFGLLGNFFIDVTNRDYSHLNIDNDDLTYIMRLFDHYGYEFEPVQIMTIHQSKGLEADTVILVPDITSKIAQAEEGRSNNPDARESERRVWYTGITRAKKRLIMLSRTEYSNYKSRVMNVVAVFVERQTKNNPI